ncbi:MAG TPA: hypothetical protein VL984_06740, partial [Acidimicrobiales bacterium]|nr:hypothetical protein [Acidimicrobiales bacterium]
ASQRRPPTGPGAGPASQTTKALPNTGALKAMGPTTAFKLLAGAVAAAQEATSGAASQACATQPPATARRQALLGTISAAQKRQLSVLGLLGGDKAGLAKISGGPRLVGLLTQDAALSARVDADYYSWVEDLQATGCYSAPDNDFHYIEATRGEAELSRAQLRISALSGR